MSQPLLYRFWLAEPLPAHFTSWFPSLVAQSQSDGSVVIEGPVADACQLAGIVTSICYRNGNILSMERLEIDLHPRH